MAATKLSVVLVGAVTLIAGCGRLHFDPSAGDDAGGDARRSDGPRDGVLAGPIALWKLDEGGGFVAVDSIGGLVGNLQNGASTDPTWVAGHVNTALLFTGDGDTVNLGNPGVLANLAAVSVAAWVVPTSTTDDGQSHCIFDKEEPGIGGWAVDLFGNSNGDIRFAAGFQTADLETDTVANVLVPGTGTEVVVSWAGTASAAGVHIYVGGGEVAHAAELPGSGARMPDEAVSAFINCNAGTSLAGVIDEVAIYDRVLTPAEVASL